LRREEKNKEDFQEVMDRYQNLRKEVNGKSEGGKGSMNFIKGEKRKERVKKEREESKCKKSGKGNR
jgi:hypothetical protein